MNNLCFLLLFVWTLCGSSSVVHASATSLDQRELMESLPYHGWELYPLGVVVDFTNNDNPDKDSDSLPIQMYWQAPDTSHTDGLSRLVRVYQQDCQTPSTTIDSSSLVLHEDLAIGIPYHVFTNTITHPTKNDVYNGQQFAVCLQVQYQWRNVDAMHMYMIVSFDWDTQTTTVENFDSERANLDYHVVSDVETAPQRHYVRHL